MLELWTTGDFGTLATDWLHEMWRAVLKSASTPPPRRRTLRLNHTPAGVPAISRGLSPPEAEDTPGHESNDAGTPAGVPDRTAVAENASIQEPLIEFNFSQVQQFH